MELFIYRFILLALVAAVVVMQVLSMLGSRSASRPHTRGVEYAKLAITYAQAQGGQKEQQLAHALGAFRLIDTSNSGKRDFSDNQARVFIETVMQNGKAAS